MSPDPYILDQDNRPEAQVKRPVFLTVLCILTFTGVGLSLIMNLASISVMKGYYNTSDGGNALRDYYMILGASIAGAMLCLAGAIMMWKLKRVGYYIYIAGHAIPLGVSASVLGTEMFTAMGLLFSLLFPAVFIILYGVNFRHLK